MNAEFRKAVVPEEIRRRVIFDNKAFHEYPADWFDGDDWKLYDSWWMIINTAPGGAGGWPGAGGQSRLWFRPPPSCCCLRNEGPGLGQNPIAARVAHPPAGGRGDGQRAAGAGTGPASGGAMPATLAGCTLRRSEATRGAKTSVSCPKTALNAASRTRGIAIRFRRHRRWARPVSAFFTMTPSRRCPTAIRRP